MRWFMGVVVSISALSACPAMTAKACECAPVTPDRSLEFSDAVFIGMPFLVRLTVAGNPERPMREAVMEAYGCWKGSVSDTVHVFTEILEAACGFPFVAGEEYLVYAGGRGRFFTTDLCQTKKLALAQLYDFQFIGPPGSCAVGIQGSTWSVVKQLYKGSP